MGLVAEAPDRTSAYCMFLFQEKALGVPFELRCQNDFDGPKDPVLTAMAALEILAYYQE